MVKLNLGAGDVEVPGYTPIDIKNGQNVYPLDVPENSVDDIYASHILEHFASGQLLEVLKNWISKLKPGGWIRIAVPDFKKCIEPYNRGKKTKLLSYVMGGQTDENDFHKSIFDNESLSALMKACGLIGLKLWKSEIKDCAALPISLNIMGQKPIEGLQPKKQDKPNIMAVMSMPRLCFADNMFCAMRALLPLGIYIDRGIGVFWGQMLTRMIEKYLDDGTEWILTLDYDTWFLKEHVTKLIQLMKEHPEADAIMAVQNRREGDSPLIAIDGPPEQTEVVVPYSEFQKPLLKVGTGHFGLTLFRVSTLKKLKKPWFLPIPAPDKSWNAGRQDEDIYFWNQFKEQGFKAYQANEVMVGHLQMMCSFPGRLPLGPSDDWTTVNMYMGELEQEGPPIHCVPDVSYLE
jgi:hypothetical protein